MPSGVSEDVPEVDPGSGADPQPPLPTPRSLTPPDIDLVPPAQVLYRPLVATPVKRTTATPVPPAVQVLQDPPATPGPVTPRPSRQRPGRTPGMAAGAPDSPTAGAEENATVRRSGIHDPNRLLPPGRPGAPGLPATTEPRRTVGVGGRGGELGGHRRVRRGMLVGFVVVGIAAGALGGLRLGHEIARARTVERLTGGLVTDTSAGTGQRARVDAGAQPEVDRAAATGTTTVADRGAQGLPRVGGPATAGISAAAGGSAAAGISAATGGSVTRAAPVPSSRTNLYVYWVTSSATRSLLAREYRNVPDYGDPLVSAVQAVLRQRPMDPDYDSPWRPADTVAVRTSATGITVTVSTNAFAATGVSSGVAAAAVQQLVWTVTSAAQRDVPVTVQVVGRTAFQAWGAVTLGTPVRRDTRFRTCVWIDTPQEAGVQHGTVRIAGQGSAFEGTYRWKVTRSGKQVAAGVATGSPAGPGAKWTQFAVDVSLPAGSYLLMVTADDPGEQEQPAGWSWPDTRSFTVG